MQLSDYHQNIENLWQNIEEQLEAQECDVDCDTQGSVFTITLDDGNQIIINKQEPLLELWLASRAGGYHFKFKDNQWVNQEGETFWALLIQAFAYYGEKVSFND